MLYLGADHRGFALKESLKAHLVERGVAFEDVGAHELTPGDDYVDFALAAARAVAERAQTHRAILLCGSGVGMDIVANKVDGVRAALVTGLHQALASRHDDNANVMVLEADKTTADEAAALVDRWLATPFSNEERHRRRLEKIAEVESSN